MRLRSLAGQRLFTWWFGFGLPPLLAGALAIAFTEHALLGGAAAAVFIARFYETGRTTCSRCACHGAAKCGLRHHGLLYRLRSRQRTGTPVVVHVRRPSPPRVPTATIGLTEPAPY
jgi:hypothetical protein